jgi:hypothetical protein
MILHIPKCIKLYGIPNLWDMTQYEKGHIRVVKKPYLRTSRLNVNVQSEIIHIVQTKRIYSDTLTIYREEFNKRIKFAEERSKLPLFYLTEEGIKYTYYKMPSTSERIIFYNGHWKYIGQTENPFLNPISNIFQLDTLLNNSLGEIFVDDLVRKLQRNTITCSLSLVSNIIIESEKLGIPNSTLCCNRFVNNLSA